MSNIWHDINPRRISPEKFMAVIEIPKGVKNKYEMDKETGLLRLDRVLYTSTHYPANYIILDRILYTSTHYPANYGFIPRTYAADNDPLDVLALCQESIVPMTLVECYPIGVMKMIDDDQVDEKIIAIPFNDPSYAEFKDINQLPQHTFSEISHFFRVYKSLEGKETVVNEVLGPDEAKEVIKNCIAAYKDMYC